MFKNLKLTPRVAGSIALTLLITSTVGFFITQKRINSQAEDAFVDKLRKTDGMADRVRTYFSANADSYLPNHQFKELKQVPVVVAWSVAREYAESPKQSLLPHIAGDECTGPLVLKCHFILPVWTSAA